MAKVDCNLCQEIAKKANPQFGTGYERAVQKGENIIFESENFVVIPSAGPLNGLHVMLVPKAHMNNFASLKNEEKNEASENLEKLRKYVKEKFQKRLVFFESGAGTLTDHSGGCIVHAHIHCVPESNEFHKKILNEIAFQKITSNSYDSADLKNGYVWYCSAEKEYFMCNMPLLPSQFLRYAYLESTKKPGMWNWRRYPNSPELLKVIKNYRGIRPPKIN